MRLFGTPLAISLCALIAIAYCRFTIAVIGSSEALARIVFFLSCAALAALPAFIGLLLLLSSVTSWPASINIDLSAMARAYAYLGPPMIANIIAYASRKSESPGIARVAGLVIAFILTYVICIATSVLIADRSQ